MVKPLPALHTVRAFSLATWSRRSRWLGWALVLLLGGALACATTPEMKVRSATKLLREGKTDEAIVMLEQIVEEAPENVAALVTLGGAYLGKAEEALNAEDEAEYLRYTERAQERLLMALELDPDQPSAHNLLAILAFFRDDLAAAEQSFRIASQLSPRQPAYYLNLAEINVYLGRFARARRNIDLARKLGAPPAEIELVEVLSAWRRGDYIEARDIFEDVAMLNPDRARTWNGAEGITSFDDLVAHCCQLDRCGPHMAPACEDMNQRVAERKRAVETVRRELELEAKRSERVSEIYRDRKDIEISVEDDEGDSKSSP